MIVTILYVLSVICSTLLLCMMLASLHPEHRFWPPAGDTKKRISYWILALGNIVGFSTVIIADSLLLNTITITDLFGAVTIGLGLLITGIAIKQLGFRQTTGKDTALITKGIYRYTRNPQIVGNLLILLGVSTAFPTSKILLLSTITAAWLLTMPFPEEEWLKNKYGNSYNSYREKTHRFI